MFCPRMTIPSILLLLSCTLEHLSLYPYLSQWYICCTYLIVPTVFLHHWRLHPLLSHQNYLGDRYYSLHYLNHLNRNQGLFILFSVDNFLIRVTNLFIISACCSLTECKHMNRWCRKKVLERIDYFSLKIVILNKLWYSNTKAKSRIIQKKIKKLGMVKIRRKSKI